MRELREATGMPLLIDGAQSVGAIDLTSGSDVSAADFYTGSAQKWLVLIRPVKPSRPGF
mgnify:CR=1 FL=1